MPKLRLQLPVLIFAAIFLGDCVLNSYGMLFPAYWHADEFTKAQQLQTGNYNFYHPQLMLWLASLMKTALFMGDSTRAIVLAGRLVSNIAIATAVVAFGVLVMRRFGIVFGVIAALLIALTPTVFITAHYFKEDATLLMCVSLTLLAMQSFLEQPGWRNVLLLGLTLGLVMSAKYVGMVMAIPVAAVLAVNRSGWRDVTICFAVAVLVFFAVNFTTFLGRGSMLTGLVSEIKHYTTDHQGITWGPFSPRTLLNFWKGTSIPFTILWIVGMLLQGFYWLRGSDDDGHRSSRTIDVLVMFMPLLWLALVQLSAVAAMRHVLSVTALATVAAVWTTAAIIETSRFGLLRFAPAIVLALGAVASMPTFAAAIQVLKDDPRARLTAWLRSNLPPDAKIASEFFNGLPAPDLYPLDQTVPLLPQSTSGLNMFSGGAGAFEGLCKSGITHIAISSAFYDRYFDNMATFMSDVAIGRRRFYERVFAELTPIHEEPLRTDIDPVFTSRHLVYKICKPGNVKPQ